jgi:hypothetical protein
MIEVLSPQDVPEDLSDIFFKRNYIPIYLCLRSNLKVTKSIDRGAIDEGIQGGSQGYERMG